MNSTIFFLLIGVIFVSPLYKFYQIFSYDPKREIEKLMKREQKRLVKLGKSILQFKWIVEEEADRYNGIIIDKETGKQLPITLSASKTRPQIAKFAAVCYLILSFLLCLLLPFLKA